MSDTPKVIPTAEHARNLERQRDAALKASNEHFQASVEMAKQVSDLQLANKELLQKLNVATGSLPLSQAAHEITDYRSELEKELAAARRERDEANMSRDGAWIAYKETTRVLESIAVAMELTCDYDADVVIEALATLQSERDRLREELAMAKADASNYKGANISKAAEISQIRAALATAQVNEANLCCVIAAAFAETAKPLNASVEYDATPTAAERLKKVQEILSSAIDAADHGAQDYQAAQAEAAADKRRLDWLESTVRGTGASRFYRSAFITLGDGLNILVDVKTHGIFEGDSIRAALDAASATEAKRIPVKVRMAEDLGPDLWAIMAPNTPRFWVKKGDEVPVKCNQHGVMTLLTPHGELGVKPQECEIIEWQYPASATEGGQP